MGGFNAFFKKALNYTGTATFDPFANDVNFLVSMWTLEEIGATGDKVSVTPHSAFVGYYCWGCLWQHTVRLATACLRDSMSCLRWSALRTSKWVMGPHVKIHAHQMLQKLWLNMP